MRSDLHNLPNDSSSGSSSPHSNTSHEEPLELDSASNMLHQKVVYNFSIPEYINHEPRIDREERSRAEVRRKRNRIQRQQQQQQQQQQSLEGEEEEHVDAVEIPDSPVIVQSTKKRRRAAAVVEADDGDDDCHRRHVPVIDLTGIDSHEEFNSRRSDSDDRPYERSAIFRPQPPYRDRHEFGHILSDIERSQLSQTRERYERLSRFYYRSPSMQRLHRMQQLRRRNENHLLSNHRQVIADHPRFTDDMMIQDRTTNNLDNNRTINDPNTGSADDSVLIVNEVRGTAPTTIEEADRAIAQFVEDDPTFPPPFLQRESLPRSRHHGHGGRSFDLIHERLRMLRQRRELAETDRLNLNRSFLERDEVVPAESNERMGLRNRNRTTNNGEDDDTTSDRNSGRRESTRQNERNSAARMNASDNTREEEEDNSGEVEFIGEWNVRNTPGLRQRYTQPALLPILGSPLGFGIEHRHHFFRLLPTQPRLHHIYQENYEALLNLADTLGPGKPRGLEKAEIERIPSFRFSTNTAKQTNIKCVICISEYTNREKLRRLPCKHDFHAKCIDKWLKANKTCPVCRDDVKVAPSE